MTKNLFYLCVPVFLTGCIGAFVSNQTEYLSETYPDIRNVPERAEAIASRGLHPDEEKTSRAVDLQQLQQDWKNIKVRDKNLREEIFPSPTE